MALACPTDTQSIAVAVLGAAADQAGDMCLSKVTQLQGDKQGKRRQGTHSPHVGAYDFWFWAWPNDALKDADTKGREVNKPARGTLCILSQNFYNHFFPAHGAVGLAIDLPARGSCAGHSEDAGAGLDLKLLGCNLRGESICRQ